MSDRFVLILLNCLIVLTATIGFFSVKHEIDKSVNEIDTIGGKAVKSVSCYVDSKQYVFSGNLYIWSKNGKIYIINKDYNIMNVLYTLDCMIM